MGLQIISFLRTGIRKQSFSGAQHLSSDGGPGLTFLRSRQPESQRQGLYKWAKFILHSRGYRHTVLVIDEKLAMGTLAKPVCIKLANQKRSKNACKDLKFQFPAFSSCANTSLPARPKHKTHELNQKAQTEPF